MMNPKEVLHVQFAFRSHQKFSFLFLFPFIILCMSFTSSAADITVAWDANNESELAGYILFYNSESKLSCC